MDQRPRSVDGLERLEAVFRDTAGAELHETDVAELSGLDEDECRALLATLRATGVIEERRSRVYIGQPGGGAPAGDRESTEL